MTEMQGLSVSTDKAKLEIDKIHDYIANHTYWGKERTLAQVSVSIDKSICFGVYHDGEQIAFARVISDTVTFAYLLDVFVFEAYQGQGVGTFLMESILNYPEFKSVNWLLRTRDAHALYKRFGFANLEGRDGFMIKSMTNKGS